jgi:hypothetical protein
MPKHRPFLKRVNRATPFGDDNEGASSITRLFNPKAILRN